MMAKCTLFLLSLISRQTVQIGHQHKFSHCHNNVQKKIRRCTCGSMRQIVVCIILLEPILHVALFKVIVKVLGIVQNMLSIHNVLLIDDFE